MKKTLSILLAILLVVASTCAIAEEFDWSGSGTVTVYCGHDEAMATEIFNAFTEKTGVTVEPVFGGGGELMARIEAEAENPLCDCVYGVSASLLPAHVDLFEKYTINSVTPAQIGLKRDEFGEDYWFGGAGGSIMVFLVNKDMMSEEEMPRSWADLTDEKYFGKIGFTDPSASSSAYIQLCIMQQLYGWDFVEAFYKNLDGKIQSSSSAVPRGCVDGEYPIAVTLEHMSADYIASGANVEVIYPEDGTMETQSGKVILKGCKNPENAQLFVEFTYSEEVAEIFNSYHRRSARADVAPAAGLANYDDIVFMDYDDEQASDTEGILAKWNEIVINN